MARVQASSSVHTEFTYECVQCGYNGRARVEGEGYAEADGEKLQAQTAEHAEGQAWNDALTTVELAPCPQCGARDRARWRVWLGSQVVGSLAWGAVAAAIACAASFLLLQRMDATPLLCGGVAWVVVALAVIAQRVQRKLVHASSLIFRNH